MYYIISVMKRKNNTPRLTEKESEIMAMLWASDGLFVREMLEKYPDPKPHFNTVSTLVRILEEKGFVGHEVVGGSYCYFAIAKSTDFAAKSLSQIIKNYFRGSASAAVSALVEEEQLSLDELKEIIKMVENKESH